MIFQEIVQILEFVIDVKLLEELEVFIENLVFLELNLRELTMAGSLPGVVKSSW